MNDEILINKRSANATNNGFEFQYAAALLIYFKHISETLYFGIEKKNDIWALWGPPLWAPGCTDRVMVSLGQLFLSSSASASMSRVRPPVPAPPSPPS